MDRKVFLCFWCWLFINCLTKNIEKSSKSLFSNRYSNWSTSCVCRHSSYKSVSRAHSNTSYCIITKMCSNFQYKLATIICINSDCFIYSWKLICRKFNIKYCADNLCYLSYTFCHYFLHSTTVVVNHYLFNHIRGS